ncbi:hypothetical protein [Nostoc sp. CMAA1605]|uniref:hypothetical protein n=1 Tax=Nostoc sp. CMAA1605 TaxID=2055159 RepID=UPI001F30C306|nr:hypothetical protein [Nostoc sp. CMAA1605]
MPNAQCRVNEILCGISSYVSKKITLHTPHTFFRSPPNAPCPMPNAQCPMPNRILPLTNSLQLTGSIN